MTEPLSAGYKPYNLHRLLTAIEVDALIDALRKHNNCRAKAANYLGMKRTTFIEKLKTHRLAEQFPVIK